MDTAGGNPHGRSGSTGGTPPARRPANVAADSTAPVVCDPVAVAVKRAPFLAIAACFATGVAVSNWTAAPFAFWCSLGVAAIAAAVVAALARRPAPATAAILAAFVAAGGADHAYQYFHLPPDDMAHHASDDRILVKLDAIVRTEPVITLKRPLALSDPRPVEPWYETALDADVSAIIGGGGTQPARGRVKVKIAGASNGLHYGDRVRLVGELQAPAAASNPAQFDYRTYLRRHGIRAVLYVSDAAGAEVVHQARGIRRLIAIVRRHVVSLLSTGGRSRGGSILAAMLAGAVEELSPEVIASFQNSGAMHLLAVSGLHVGIIAATVWWLVQIIRLPPRARSLIIVAAVIGYTLMTGARTPAVRAAVMIVLAAMGGIVTRRQISINSLAFAAFAILVVSPCELFMVGFQLSFLAIFGILYFYTPIRNLLNRLKSPLEDLQAPEEQSAWLRLWGIVRRWAFPPISASLAASIGVLPVIAHTFNVVNVSGLICNAIFVPFASVVVVSGFLTLVVQLPLSLVWSGASILSVPAAMLAAVLEKVAYATTLLPVSYYYASAPPAWFLLIYYALLVAIINRNALRLRPARLIIAAAGLLALLAVSSLGFGQPRRMTATVFDVRHGNCVFFQFPSGKTMLYDCGNRNPFYDAGSQVVAPALWKRGIHRIDVLMISHCDSDHIVGAISLIPRFRIGCVFMPPGFAEEPIGGLLVRALDENRIPHRELTAGQVVTLDGVRVEILSPPASSELKAGTGTNNRSLVARVLSASHSFVLSGDVETPAIMWLLNSGQDVRADVLLLPHHGASPPDCLAMAGAVRPSIVIASCDRTTASEDLAAALRANGSQVLRTSDCGAINLIVDGGTLTVKGFRETMNDER